MQTTRTKLQREPRTGHEMDATGYVFAGNQIRKVTERLRSTSTPIDEKFDIPPTTDSELCSNKTIISSTIIYYRYNFYGIILNIYYSHKIYNGFSWRSNLLKMCYLCYIQFKYFLMVTKRSCKLLITILINARKSHACRFKILLFIFFFNGEYYQLLRNII